jgi:hypothetical protein
MRGPLGNYFQNTVKLCFDLALHQMGPIVREAVIVGLEEIGIRESEFGPRFEEVARVLIGTFGATARTLVYRTLALVCEEYSLSVDFTFKDPLVEKFMFLQNRVLVDRLTPRNIRRALPDDQYLLPTYVSVIDMFSADAHRVRG